MRTWLRRWWDRFSGSRGRQVGVCLIALVVAVGSAVGVWIDRPAQGWLTLGLGLIGTVALWWRQRHPVIVMIIGIPLTLVTNFIVTLGAGLLSLSVRRRDRLLVLMTVVAALAYSAPMIIANRRFSWSDLITGAVTALIFALWGAYVGTRRDLLDSLRERADRAEQEREVRADQARTAERARIAREMHDVLAHKVSLIALQAGGLEMNPAAGPESVEDAAGRIRSTAREAMEDLRQVLGVLRSDDSGEGVDLAPQPGLADLPRLVESSRAAGVQVALTIECPDPPDQLGRTGYRVIQEALTNVHKHARGAATTVRVAGGPTSGLMVEVVNRRPVSAGSLLPGSGAGLIGLAERVGLEGGRLDSGPTTDGGWRLAAMLPWPAAADSARPGPAAVRSTDSVPHVGLAP